MSSERRSGRRWVRWVPVLVVIALIFVLSSQSGLRVSDDVAVEKPLRVSGHLLAFATLAALSMLALGWGRRPRLRDALIALGITVTYGLLDEFHQSFVPDRNGRLDDVVTDTIGALMGIGLAWIVLTVMASRRRPSGVGDGL